LQNSILFSEYTSLSTKLEVDTVREGEACVPEEKCSQCAWAQNYLSDFKFSHDPMYSWIQLLPCPKTLTLESAATRLPRSTPHRWLISVVDSGLRRLNTDRSLHKNPTPAEW